MNAFLGTKYRPNYDFGLVQLDIVPTWADDEADYTCVAVNRYGRDETTGGLNVAPAPDKGEPPKFITQLERPST